MNHALILPILLPMLAGALLLVGHNLSKPLKRALSLTATWALVPLGLYLVLLADDGQLRAYALGNWQAPFGIMLLLDRLSALMLLLTAVLAGFAVLYASRGDDARGQNFHALFQFQLLGINGAFLTADLFNLFVFFEILLISSYSLLVHGNGKDQIKAGVHYVVLNLLGSSFFLIGVSMLYGLSGTLNMPDLAQKVADADPELAPLFSAAAYLLLVVFALKAAVLPLYFWLPKAYASAPAPVAALFAIMTKVGLYSIFRVFTLVFGEGAGPLANMAHEMLWWLALLTLAAGAIGALAAERLQVLLGYLVVVSVGTLLAGFSLGTPQALSAALYYLVHSTLISAALFLLAGLIVRQRGPAGDDLHLLQALHQPLLLGALFFAATISVAGLPPFSGFLGKLLLLRSVEPGSQALWLWSVVLLSGLVTLVALSRAGSQLFWHSHGRPLENTAPADWTRLGATLGLLLASPLLLVMAQPLLAYAQGTAEQLLNLQPYLSLINGGEA
ncbi:monovalent cation/H+ antiporter subunit D [Pseudomonas berkeleyensis]|uniref:Monovalent cation/H+ antiporter subunit D n=1 Tax=Pseudomonas berkeleyensis TaxID=2726956 RepID=A0A7G5DJU3_9PSED|nr:monovalent cation/H+ antiporter subunit D [Pseudomonas berkeleyensis]QMV62018.1 monovalent cation/H+ antiporter subunit D [Pseudomonas berkeleyensis]WSO37461.1 monovalent cation/H+ antiporter subunit D [Pseudomonas berkeleyensis]